MLFLHNQVMAPAYCQELRGSIRTADKPPSPQGPLTLPDAILIALKNYPSILEREARADAAASNVSLTKTTYLPRLDLYVQELRGSTNNVLGVLFPPLAIPQVAGPPNRAISFRSYWLANTSAFSSWEIMDFGLRAARVREAKSNTNRANAETALTKFQVATDAADAFFNLAAAEQAVLAEQANLDRMKVFARTVHTLVSTDLRPGVDSSRADAEVALAEDRVIAAEQEREVRRASLAEKLGLAGMDVRINSANLMRAPNEKDPPAFQSFQYHPLAMHQTATIQTVRAKQFVLQKEWLPRIYLESAIFARGSGAEERQHVSKIGYLPSVPNWAVGIKAEFPVMQYFPVKFKKKIEANIERAEQARLAEIMQVLKGKGARAQAVYEGAIKLNKNAPILLKAAEETELRSRTRYGVGLNTIVDVADSERLLTQAQVTYNLAGLGVWRAILAAAEAHGDLAPFLKIVGDLK